VTVSEPSISVVIPTYQRPVYLDRAIQSVLQQSYSHCEIVVVDDNGQGSGNQLETAQLLKKYTNDARVSYVVLPQNRGGGGARNAGIEHSNSQYIGFLDDDDEWLPEFAQRHLDVFEQSNADIVYCGYKSVHDDDNTIREQKPEFHRGGVIEHLLRGWCPVSTSLFMIKRASLPNSEPFDASFPSFQDFDCWLSLARDLQFDYCEDALLLKHGHGVGQISVNPVTRQRGLDLLASKWRERLSPAEWKVFENTLVWFKKELYRKEFLVMRQKEGIVASIPKALRFLRYDKFRVRECARVLKSMAFPYR